MEAGAVPQRRVVVADDHEPTRVLLETLVELMPSLELVAAAGDGAEAVRLAMERDADVVLLDVNMPRLDGLAAAELIRSYRPATRVVLHTGEPPETIRERAAGLGVPVIPKGRTDDVLAAAAAAAPEAVDVSAAPIEPIVLAALTARDWDNVFVCDGGLNVLYSTQSARREWGGDEVGARRGEVAAETFERFRFVWDDGSERAAETLPLVRAATAREPVTDDVCELRGDEVVRHRVTATPYVERDALLGVVVYSSLVGTEHPHWAASA